MCTHRECPTWLRVQRRCQCHCRPHTHMCHCRSSALERFANRPTMWARSVLGSCWSEKWNEIRGLFQMMRAQNHLRRVNPSSMWPLAVGIRWQSISVWPNCLQFEWYSLLRLDVPQGTLRMVRNIVDKCVAAVEPRSLSMSRLSREVECTLDYSQHRSICYHRDNRHRRSIRDRISCRLPVVDIRLVCWLQMNQTVNYASQIEIEAGKMHTLATNGCKCRSKPLIGDDIDCTSGVLWTCILAAWILAFATLATMCIVGFRNAVRTTQRITFFEECLALIKSLWKKFKKTLWKYSIHVNRLPLTSSIWGFWVARSGWHCALHSLSV